MVMVRMRATSKKNNFSGLGWGSGIATDLGQEIDNLLPFLAFIQL